MKNYNYFVYIISNWNNKILYVGVTNNLERRLYEHKNKLFDGFSKRYNLTKLVYYEQTSDIKSAIQREKEIKKWRREKKNQLIEVLNPKWEELFEDGKRKISQSSEETTLLRNDKQNIIGINIKISHSNEKNILTRNNRKKITGLIIAAGLSSRMGKFKPLLNYKGKSFLQNIIEKLDSICDEIIIVVGHNSEKIKSHLESSNITINYKLVHNQNYHDGMFTSLKKGVESIEKSDWVLYHFVDQPTLPKEFYSEFKKKLDPNYDWIQPVYKKQRGHPILFNKEVINKIVCAKKESNLREISQTSLINKKFWKCNYMQILTDIDTNDDYKLL